MKKFIKFFSVILAFCLSFSLAGCNNEQDKNNLTTQQVVTKIHDFINFEDLNFTINGDLNFEVYHKTFGEPKSTETHSLEDIVIKVADNNTYMFIPEDGESYQIGDYKYSNYYDYNYEEKEFELGDFNVSNSLDLSEYSGIDEFVKELFHNAFSFNSNWVSSEKQSNGGYKLNLNIDVKAIFDGIKAAFSENLENPMIDIVNDMLAVFYSDLTIQDLFDDLKDEIDEETTIQEFFDFAEAKLNLKLTNTINFVFKIMSGGEFEGYDFTKTFYSYFDIADDTEFQDFLNDTIAFLSDEDYTLPAILDAMALAEGEDADAIEFLEGMPEIADIICEVYGMISVIEMNNFKIDAAITTNATNTAISNIALALQAEIVMGDSLTIGFDISLNLDVFDVGTTQFSLPESFEVYGIYLVYDIDTDVLVEDEAYVYTGINFGDTDLEFTDSPDSTISLSYDASEGTLTLSADAVNQLLSENCLVFETEDESFYFVFYYNFVAD